VTRAAASAVAHRVVTLLLAAALAACTGGAVPRTPPDPTTTARPSASPTERRGPIGPFERMICGLPRQHALRTWRGYHPERSGQIQFFPREPNTIGAWLAHSGPWDYVQRVPIFLYGPGHVPAAGRVDRPATAADLAPTLARHLGFAFDAPDGRVLREAVDPGAEPTRLVVFLVWDSAGRNVLAEHPDAWPVLRGLIPGGAWYERAVVGSSPSVTQAIHATFGTGAFPRRHGLIDLRFQIDGKVTEPLVHGPGFLDLPTLADEFDLAHDNEPIVGVIAPHGALGMASHGSYLEGADRDIGIDGAKGSWTPMRGELERYFEYPSYVDEIGGLPGLIREMDAEDGAQDGRWLSKTNLDDPETALGTPAFSRHQTQILHEVIRREGFGADDVPDLLFVNYRQIDKVGHDTSMNSPEMEAVVRSTDEVLGDLIDILDREVGEGEWVLALTSDHGSTPHPDVSGGFLIDAPAVEADLEAAFDDDDGRPVVKKLRVTQAWIDVAELEENGHTLKDVARFLVAYTKGQNVADPSVLPEDERDDRVFAAAFPGAALTSAPCLPDGDAPA
jgi:hypothetical protein